MRTGTCEYSSHSTFKNGTISYTVTGTNYHICSKKMMEETEDTKKYLQGIFMDKLI